MRRNDAIINGKWALLLLIVSFAKSSLGQYRSLLISRVNKSAEVDQCIAYLAPPEYEKPKAVFLVHGLFLSWMMEYVKDKIIHTHPGTEVFNSQQYQYYDSMVPLQEQIDGKFGEEFRNFSDRHPEGFHVIGYSQGVPLARGMIQSYPQHNVHTFIAVAGPMAGQYGTFAPTKPIYDYIELKPFLKILSDLCYDVNIQQKNSIANFWNDPFQQERHLTYNTFLPRYDNLVPHSQSNDFKAAWLKLKGLVTIKGPNDLVIMPWQSTDFSYYREDGKLVNYTERDIYIKDTFGYRTLVESGRVVHYTVPNVVHLGWMQDDYVINNCILPHLT